MQIKIIGAGLAGCEAALWLADHGVQVDLYEQKPVKFSPAHKSAGFAELICSNSLKAERPDSASGLLKIEMRMMGSHLLDAAETARVAAGGALAVDRDVFSTAVTEMVEKNSGITVHREEVTALDESVPVLVASGPLTEGVLAEQIAALTGSHRLSFFDAVAPIVSAESLDMEKIFAASRYGRGEADYLNCPFNKLEYETFYNELLNAERAPLHDFDGELTVYEGCMPIEVMAGRGADTMRYGPLRPVGLRDPRTGHRPWANVQLRAENTARTLYNIVGFQTNLKWGEQKRVFSMIPGLEHAEFIRYGVMHRNTFLESPAVLTKGLYLKEHPNVFFAGQITGFEGYMESACWLPARSWPACRAASCPRRPPARCVVRCWIISPRPTRTSSPWVPTWAFCRAPRRLTPSGISANGIWHFLMLHRPPCGHGQPKRNTEVDYENFTGRNGRR